MASYAPGGSGQQIAPEDLLTLLAVARLGKFTAAAHSLGLNHTTVSRRIAALEKAYGERVLVASPDGWELNAAGRDRKSTRLNSSHVAISYAVFCLKKKKKNYKTKTFSE